MFNLYRPVKGASIILGILAIVLNGKTNQLEKVE